MADIQSEKAAAAALQARLQRNPALETFEHWMSSNGITWDTSLISLYAGVEGCSGPAWGVFAGTDIQEGALLCTIPKTAILSTRNTAVADILEKEKLGGGLGLTISVMYEKAIGLKSKWYGYLSSFSEREYLPIFWTDDELQQLEGTELLGKVEEDRENTEHDFETEVLPLAKKYPRRIPKQGWTLEAFRAAASLVASRAFYVDSWHGDAMVPLADVFNHKASVVELAEDFEVAQDDDNDEDEDEDGEMDDDGNDQSDDDSANDEEDGEYESDDGSADDEGETNGEGSDHSEHDSDHLDHHSEEQHAANGCSHAHKQGHDVKACPSGHCAQHDHSHHHDHNGCCNHTDHCSHACTDMQHVEDKSQQRPQGRSIMAPAANYVIDGMNLRLEIGICSAEKDDEEVLDIVAASSIVAGAEVHNTYGEHGNEELVHKYGFALRRNPFNEVTIEKEQVMAAAEKLLGGKKALRRRFQFMEKHSALLEEDEEPFLVYPQAKVNSSLWAVLWILTAPELTFKTWKDIEDALKGPKSGGLNSPETGDANAQGSTGKKRKAAEVGSCNDKSQGCKHSRVAHDGIARKVQDEQNDELKHDEHCCHGKHDKHAADGSADSAANAQGDESKPGVAHDGTAHAHTDADGYVHAEGAGSTLKCFAHHIPVASSSNSSACADGDISSSQYGWTPDMYALLKECVALRLAEYPGTLQENVAALQAAYQEPGEHGVAMRAALMLRVTEQEMLDQMLTCIAGEST